jgi:hypothetical protein
LSLSGIAVLDSKALKDGRDSGPSSNRTVGEAMSDPGAMARALERELDTQDAERRRIDKERIVMLEEALRFYAPKQSQKRNAMTANPQPKAVSQQSPRLQWRKALATPRRP